MEDGSIFFMLVFGEGVVGFLLVFGFVLVVFFWGVKGLGLVFRYELVIKVGRGFKFVNVD